MQPSGELAAVMRRLLHAFEHRDKDTFRSLISEAEETLVIGSDADEWLVGIEASEVTIAQVEELPDFKIVIHTLDAYEEGTVGWAAADTTTHIDDELAPRFRFTAVFHLEGGVWRVVQWHASVPEASEKTVGVELTSSLAQLIEALDEDAERLLRKVFREGTVTLLFTDIEESTPLTAELGDAVWTEILQRHFGDVDRIAQSRSGVVVKTTGDGAMLAFESAHHATWAAVDIQESVTGIDLPRDLKVRIGVHAGDALYAAGDYFGQTVNKAARIAAAAKGGEVLVSDVVHGLVEQAPEFTFGDAQQIQLRGIEGVTMVYPLEL